MVKHNNIRPNIHMHKDYQRWIKTHFDQPKKKKRRSKLRRIKAATKAPRPAQKLRPIVQCPTQKYNMRIRAGRGFSMLELQVCVLTHYRRLMIYSQRMNSTGSRHHCQICADYWNCC